MVKKSGIIVLFTVTYFCTAAESSATKHDADLLEHEILLQRQDANFNELATVFRSVLDASIQRRASDKIQINIPDTEKNRLRFSQKLEDCWRRIQLHIKNERFENRSKHIKIQDQLRRDYDAVKAVLAYNFQESLLVQKTKDDERFVEVGMLVDHESYHAGMETATKDSSDLSYLSGLLQNVNRDIQCKLFRTCGLTLTCVHLHEIRSLCDHLACKKIPEWLLNRLKKDEELLAKKMFKSKASDVDVIAKLEELVQRPEWQLQLLALSESMSHREQLSKRIKWLEETTSCR